MVRSSSGQTYRSVLAVRDFRHLWLAEVCSVAGDQLGRVALSILVFARTNSAALTGLTYGLTFVPTLVGTLFLAGLADHFRRRNVMLACDLVRAVLFVLVVLPGIPLWLLCVFVAGSTLFNGPFKAAQQALLPEVLDGERYLLGMSLRTISNQTAQLFGFALGGGLVAVLTPAGGLLADAVTFLVSALLLCLVSSRPVHPRPGERPLSLRGVGHGLAGYTADRRLLLLLGVAALNLFHIFPEGTAAPYAEQLGVGRYAVALILASAPLGGALGAFVFGRLVPERARERLVGVVAIGASVALLPTLAPIGLVPSLMLFAITGGLSGIYTLYASAMIAQLAPQQQRARITGVFTATLHLVNGLGPMLGGLIAGALGAGQAIAVAGLLSAVFALFATGGWAKVRSRYPMAQYQPAG